MNFTGDVIENRWVVGNKLNAGASGAIYSVTDNTNEHLNTVVKFAMVDDVDPDMDEEDKLELEEEAEAELEKEVETLEDLNSRSPTLRVPKLFLSGTHKDVSFMIITEFGDSALTLHEKADWDFSNGAVLVITKQVFEIMRKLHSLNISHGDIKESNVVRGLGDENDKFFLIDFGQSGGLVVSHPANDIGDILHMMVRMFRDDGEGLVPQEHVADYLWNNLTPEQHAVVLQNFEKAVEVRNNRGTPIPEVLKVLVHESIGQAPPDYERMSTLLQQACTQTVDPNEVLFD